MPFKLVNSAPSMFNQIVRDVRPSAPHPELTPEPPNCCTAAHCPVFSPLNAFGERGWIFSRLSQNVAV